ncbi:MAG TPA: sugar porter family MFS transporter [Terracidiphilus sp.]|jgi:SP family arabinose:H+ symporter-like MFS transporter|nr:sugar porter family MFS transporter [Terracidiphilus sp.]
MAISSASQADASTGSTGYIVFLATIVAISGFLLGFNTAVISGVLVFLRAQFSLSNAATEVATSALLLGCLLGAAGASLIGDRFGRRKSLLLTAVVFAGSTGLTALSNSVTVFSLGRLAGGLAIGLSSVLTPVYISEIAPARNRGTLVSMNQMAIVVGILIAFLVNWSFAGLGPSSWRWMLGVAIIPALVLFFGLLAVPESPRWLISHGHFEKGRQVLTRFLGAAEADVQLAQMQQAAGGEQGSWQEVFARPMRRPLVIALGLAILCQITGVNAVLYYGSILISEHLQGQTTNTALLTSVIIGCANLVSTLLAMRFLDRWGRRPMLLTAAGGMAISLGILIGAFHVPGVSTWVVLGSIISYTAFFAFGMGPVPWVVISEIFPNKIRGRAASVATSALWTGTLLVTFTFLSMIRAFGVSGTFAIFGVLSAFSFVFIWVMVPETRGKTLEEIQQQWEN